MTITHQQVKKIAQDMDPLSVPKEHLDTFRHKFTHLQSTIDSLHAQCTPHAASLQDEASIKEMQDTCKELQRIAQNIEFLIGPFLHTSHLDRIYSVYVDFMKTEYPMLRQNLQSESLAIHRSSNPRIAKSLNRIHGMIQYFQEQRVPEALEHVRHLYECKAQQSQSLRHLIECQEFWFLLFACEPRRWKEDNTKYTKNVCFIIETLSFVYRQCHLHNAWQSTHDLFSLLELVWQQIHSMQQLPVPPFPLENPEQLIQTLTPCIQNIKAYQKTTQPHVCPLPPALVNEKNSCYYHSAIQMYFADPHIRQVLSKLTPQDLDGLPFEEEQHLLGNREKIEHLTFRKRSIRYAVQVLQKAIDVYESNLHPLRTLHMQKYLQAFRFFIYAGALLRSTYSPLVDKQGENGDERSEAMDQNLKWIHKECAHAKELLDMEDVDQWQDFTSYIDHMIDRGQNQGEGIYSQQDSDEVVQLLQQLLNLGSPCAFLLQEVHRGYDQDRTTVLGQEIVKEKVCQVLELGVTTQKPQSVILQHELFKKQVQRSHLESFKKTFGKDPASQVVSKYVELQEEMRISSLQEAPKILPVSLTRFVMKTPGIFSRLDYSLKLPVHTHVYLAFQDNQGSVVYIPYHVVGALIHKGTTPDQGHYMTMVKLPTQEFVFQDDAGKEKHYGVDEYAHVAKELENAKTLILKKDAFSPVLDSCPEHLLPQSETKHPSSNRDYNKMLASLLRTYASWSYYPVVSSQTQEKILEQIEEIENHLLDLRDFNDPSLVVEQLKHKVQHLDNSPYAAREKIRQLERKLEQRLLQEKSTQVLQEELDQMSLDFQGFPSDIIDRVEELKSVAATCGTPMGLEAFDTLSIEDPWRDLWQWIQQLHTKDQIDAIDLSKFPNSVEKKRWQSRLKNLQYLLQMAQCNGGYQEFAEHLEARWGKHFASKDFSSKQRLKVFQNELKELHEVGSQQPLEEVYAWVTPFWKQVHQDPIWDHLMPLNPDLLHGEDSLKLACEYLVLLGVAPGARVSYIGDICVQIWNLLHEKNPKPFPQQDPSLWIQGIQDVLGKYMDAPQTRLIPKPEFQEESTRGFYTSFFLLCCAHRNILELIRQILAQTSNSCQMVKVFQDILTLSLSLFHPYREKLIESFFDYLCQEMLLEQVVDDTEVFETGPDVTQDSLHLVFTCLQALLGEQGFASIVEHLLERQESILQKV